MNVNGGIGRSPWSVTNLCPVVLSWPPRDVWMYVWVPSPVLFTACTVCLLPHAGLYFRKRPPSTPQYVPQWHFTCVLASARVRVPRNKLLECLYRWIEIIQMWLIGFIGARCLRKDSKMFFRETNQMTVLVLFPTVCWWPFVPWFCGLNCMPVFILSYQSGVFGICTQLSHSTQCKTGTVCSIADEYGYS